MNKVQLKFKPTTIQLFFIEKTYELMNKSTIDTYRLRLHNPKSLLQELISVAEDLYNEKLKNKEYAKTLCEELTRLLNENDSHIKFSSLDKKYFMNVISTKKELSKESLKKIIAVSNIILNDNLDYFENLSKIILTQIFKFSYKEPAFRDLEAINKVIHYFYLELFYKGYSKYYLRDFTLSIFSGLPNLSFYERFLILKSLKTKNKEIYNVLMAIDSDSIRNSSFSFFDREFKILTKSTRTRYSKITNEKVTEFIERNKSHVIFSCECYVKDYYSALLNAKEHLLKAIDVYHLSVSSRTAEIISECAVIGTLDPAKAKVYDLTYVIDGQYNSKTKMYENLATRLKKIRSATSIDTESKNKITAGLRYLRLGSESKDLGNKFINYWIGLEYLFSIHDAQSNTYARIKGHLKTCHAVIYVRRNLIDLHRSLKNQAVPESLLPDAKNLKYLLDDKFYESRVNKLNSPLLRYRCMYYRKIVNDSKKFSGDLEKHQQNIEWNIARIYRLRNEIVHNAAIKSEIEIIVSHLRYYLAFILDSVIQYFNDTPKDLNQDGKVSLEDYFIMQEIILLNYKSNIDSHKSLVLNSRIPYELLS